MTNRTLVAGFGNELRGDDGFGVEVVRELARRGLDGAASLVEVGTAGLQLVQHLLDGYDRLIIVDAAARGGSPGSVYVLAVDDVAPSLDAGDIHVAVPSRALAMARGVGALPETVFIVGCEPKHVDDLTTELSPEVRAGVDRAVDEVRRLIDGRTETRHD